MIYEKNQNCTEEYYDWLRKNYLDSWNNGICHKLKQKQLKGGTNEKMEMNEKMNHRIDMYVQLARHLKPMVDDVYGVAILKEIRKDARCDQMIANRTTENRTNNDDQPATAKQIDYLKSLGIDVEDGLTKKKASQLIESAKANNQ